MWVRGRVEHKDYYHDHNHDYQHYHYNRHHHDDHQLETWQMATVRRRALVGSLRDERTPIGLMIGMIPSCFSVYIQRWARKDDPDQFDHRGEPCLDVIRMRISLMLEILEMIRMMFKMIIITRINIITLAMDWRSLGAPVRDWSPAPKVERREPTSITWERARGEFFYSFLIGLFPEVSGLYDDNGMIIIWGHQGSPPLITCDRSKGKLCDVGLDYDDHQQMTSITDLEQY